ncbi:MAG TPA: glycosyltransferase family A protein [Candidatus Kapabacteria bacterium]|nr:glycosyltransferase family A protein [Candidatus Kapabacteria bacterium]
MASLLSIIIPVYNHEKALKQALLSIAKQTYRPCEIIVVDDGGVPAVDSHVSMIGEGIPFRLIRQENKGAPAARNAGFRASKGEYVIFWDADVLGEPEMLQKMVDALTKNREASYVYSNFYFGKKKMPAQVFDAEVLKQRNYIHSTSLIRRADVVPWDETLKRFQDWDLWLTMLEQEKRGVWIPEYLFRVLPRKGGMSTWLPSFVYSWPWCLLPGIRKKVHAYKRAERIIADKHKK